MDPAIQGRARLTNKRLLSLLLLSQLRGDWLEEKRTEFLSRTVCSDWQVKTGEKPDISIRRKVSYVKFD
jgi:hypothetical protein